MKKQWLALLISMILCISLLQGTATAKELDVNTERIHSLHYIPEQTDESVVVDVTPEITAAAATVRSGMKNRESQITVSFPITGLENLDVLSIAVFEMALAHTGDPTEGDYLRYQNRSFGYEIVDNGQASGTACIRYTFSYATTLAQEAAVDAAVADIVSRALTEGISEYRLAKDICRYIASVTEYDYEAWAKSTLLIQSDDPLPWTAYGALINGQSVCQGYALLYYRLALSLGLDCRIVAGEAEAGELRQNHGWNVVRIDGTYYYMDPTWYDSGNLEEYICRGTTDFPDHYSDDGFLQELNLATTAYVPSDSDLETLTYACYEYEPMLGEAAILRYNGNDEQVTVPAELNGMLVTSIAGYAFSGLDSLEKLSFSEGIRHLDSFSVCGCPNLKEIRLPSTIMMERIEYNESIFGIGGDPWISDCPSLERYVVAESNPFIKSVEGVLFNNDLTVLLYYPQGKQDRSYAVPSGILSIGMDSFSGVQYLEEVTLPNTVLEINYWAFNHCASLNRIHMSQNCTRIGQYCFQGTQITELEIPSSLNLIVEGAFIGTTISRITIDPGNTTYRIQDNVLYGAFEDGEILLYYLAGQSQTTLVIPDDVVTIGQSAFENAANLQKVTIGSQVMYIHADAFSGCTSLTETNYLGTAEQWSQIEMDRCNNILLKTLTNPISVSSVYDGSINWNISGSTLTFSGSGSLGPLEYNPSAGILYYPWSNYSDIIENVVIEPGIMGIGNYAFADFGQLSHISIPTSITDIGAYAFMRCEKLDSISLPDGLQHILDHAFQHSNFVHLEIPSSVASIGKYAFGSCNSLQSVAIDGNLLRIEEGTFSSCYELTSIGIPKSVVCIENEAFISTSLTDVFFSGIQSEWTSISIESNNERLFDASIHFSSILRPSIIAPELIGARASAGQITVEWRPVDGATKYAVYRKTSGENWTLLNGAVTGNSYTDKSDDLFAGTVFCYTVRAFVDTGWGCYDPAGISVTAASEQPSIQYSEKTINIGASFQFEATGGSGSYTWHTGNSSVATVDTIGKVTGKTVGNTYLYCRDSAGREAKCLLKVVEVPLSIRYGEKTVSNGGSFQFEATGGTGGYTWRVGNTSIATVNSTGKVTGVSVGSTYLYCKDSSGAEVKCLLKVVAPPSIRYGEKTVSNSGNFQFTATGGTGGYTWRVGNPSIATVNSTGKVTGVSVGSTYLYCKDSSGAEVKCLLKVVAPPSIRYAEKIVTKGVPFQFTATGGTGGYTWRTGNTATATVDTTGKVTGKAVGNTYLYCKDSSGVEVKCLLKVIAPLSIRYGEKIVMIGTPFQFEATGGSGSYTWRTGNTATATVSTTGKVTGKTAGNTYLYCRDSYGNEVKCLLKVIAPVSIRYAEKTVNVGSAFQCTATGGSGSYTWRTGNTATATVSTTGKVTGKTAGNTYLYCRDSYGNEVKCLLKIK